MKQFKDEKMDLKDQYQFRPKVGLDFERADFSFPRGSS